MNDILYKSLLFDFYGKLLTEKQRGFYEMYYFENLTLNEIGSEFGVTLQAAGDIIRRTEKNLADYEQKLGLVSDYESRGKILNEICADLDNLESEALKLGKGTEILSRIEILKADVMKLTV